MQLKSKQYFKKAALRWRPINFSRKNLGRRLEDIIFESIIRNYKNHRQKFPVHKTSVYWLFFNQILCTQFL
jgi:hypothetical protein